MLRKAAAAMVMATILPLAAALAGCDARAPASHANAAPLAANHADGPAWRYSTQRVPLDHTLRHLACVTSTDMVSIGIWGRTYAVLCLRQGGGGDAYITLGDTRGQFVCMDCEVRARFDDGRIVRFAATDTSSDYQDHTLFFYDRGRIAAALRHARVASFEVTLYDGGDQEVSFPVAGLQWPPR